MSVDLRKCKPGDVLMRRDGETVAQTPPALTVTELAARKSQLIQEMYDAIDGFVRDTGVRVLRGQVSPKYMTMNGESVQTGVDVSITLGV
jgi:hypothetical protein